VKENRGSVLVMVVVVATILFMLTGVVYTYFQMNARTALFRMNRARAATAAEAGTALALHHLSSLETLPAGGAPFVLQMEGDSSGWIRIPEGDRVYVVIDPVNGPGGLCENGAVEVRSRGLAGDVTMDVELRATPAFPSSYALLTDEGIPDGFFVDGRIVDGPVHSNGPVCFSSYSPDSTGDPYVAMISTTPDGGFIFSGTGRSDVPHPEGSNTWVRPYPRHMQGPPYWRTSSPEIDYSRMMSHFRSLVTGGIQNDAVRISAERVLIEGNRLLYKENEAAEERVQDLTGVNLVIVRNGFAPVMIKTIRMPMQPLTIIAENDMAISGGIDGGAAGSGGPLGLVALGDILIPADPDETGGEDWSGRYQIETDRGFMIRASLAVPSGSFEASVPYLPGEKARVTIVGSLTQVSMGRLSSGNSGYEIGVSWDQGLGAMHPPYFPMLGRWNIYSWLTDPPGREDSDIEDDRV
jgi:hypothetical protein